MSFPDPSHTQRLVYHIPAKVEQAGWLDWTYKGVDHSFPGNGGLECRDFLSLSQRYWESGAASFVALLALALSYPRLRLPPRSRPCDPCCVPASTLSRCGTTARPSMAQVATVYEPVGKRILLLLMCLTFGIELGFKFATRQMIWIGNPCHLATMMQIFILSAPPSRIVTAAFRLHMHMLTGAPIAILFPVINTRLLPFETGVYFLQHVLMLIIPFYCLWVGDPFIPEKLNDFSWAMTSFGLLFLYHFIPLQFLAYISHVNLNNMLCPAVSDPFRGKFYRLFAIGHQFVLIPTLGKVFVLLAKAFGILARDPPPDCEHAATVITAEDCPSDCSPCCSLSTTCLSSGACGSNPPCSSFKSCYGRGSEFYRKRRFSCPDEDCGYVRSCRRDGCTSSVYGNTCWSNTSGVSRESSSNEHLQQGEGVKTAKPQREEEGDSGFLGGTASGETISTASNFSASTGFPSGSEGDPDEAAFSKDSFKGVEAEENFQQVSDTRPCQRGQCSFRVRLDNGYLDENSRSLIHRGDYGDSSGSVEDRNNVQHIVNGQMVESRSLRHSHGDAASMPRDERIGGQNLRHRRDHDHQLNNSISRGSQRKSGEIIVEGGPPLRAYEVKNCGNSSKVTSSVEKAFAGAGKDDDDNREGCLAADFRKLRSKVH